MKYKKILLKNLKINFFRYISFILSSSFAITIQFIYSTVIWNTYILKNDDSNFINYTVSFSAIYIMMSAGIFVVYSYDNYMKWRTDEFTTFILLGITKRELKRLLLAESFILLVIALVIGTCFGIIFSKVFFLSMIKICGLKYVIFKITYRNYISVAVLFLWISLLMIYKICSLSKLLNFTSILKYKNKPITIKNKNSKLRLLIIILIACFVYKKMSISFPRNMKIYVTNVFITIVVVYLSVNPIIRLISFFMERGKFKVYLQIKSMGSMFDTCRKLTFLLAFLSFMIISYIRINYLYSIEYNNMKNILEINRSNFITFTYIFTIIPCFFIFSRIIFYKTDLDIAMMKRLYDRLFKIGITENEFKKLIKLKLRVAFLEPFILSLFISAVYIEISNLKFRFSFITVLIYLVYFILLLPGYFNAKRKYNEEIFH